jgi:adenine-specific DNA-methyltransferase
MVMGKNGYCELVWDGKTEAAALVKTAPEGRLLLCEGESRFPGGTGNHYIEGDNLDALKLLLPQYRGGIKVIYIRPTLQWRRGVCLFGRPEKPFKVA